jgi:molybdopterin molybdotransferase
VHHSARLAVPLSASGRLILYLLAVTRYGSDGKLEVVPFTHQDSSMLSLLAQADCLVIRPPLAPAAQPGNDVPILPFATGLASI